MRFEELDRLVDKRDALTIHPKKKYTDRKVSAIRKIAIHHSLTMTGSAEAFANYHVNHNKWPGIGYHFVIEKDGDIIYCNSITKKSYHVGKSNRFALGICLVGDFRYQKPTDEQIKSLNKLLVALMEDLEVEPSDVLGHNEFAGYAWKPCPVINMHTLRSNLRNEKNEELLPDHSYESVKEYVIERDDTFWKIANDFDHVNIKDLLLANPDINPKRLRIGQTIKIPY